MSVSDVERGLVARYSVRMLERGALPMRAVRHILYWLNERSESLSLPIPKRLADAIGNIYASGFKAAEFERAWHANRRQLLVDLEAAARETERPEPLATNLGILVKALGLPDVAVRIVGLVACTTRFEQVQYLSSSVVETAGSVGRAVALMVGESARDVDALISPSGELVTSGLLAISDEDEIAGHSGRFSIPFRLNACLDQTFETFESMRDVLLGEPVTSIVQMADYDHVADDRDLITGVLKGADAALADGVNILIYGPPGSGKTELAKVVAKAAGVQLFATGEDVHHEGESDRGERLSDMVFSQRLLAGSRHSALLFDEMEDIAVHLLRRGGSKVYLNRLLETNSVPVVWTSNDLFNIDPALLRRMTLAIELKRPPPAQRRRILTRLVERIDLTLSEDEIETLAQRLEATPAILENALLAAKYSGGGADAVERAALGIVRAVSGVATRRPGVYPQFEPDLVCANMDLPRLAEQLEDSSARAFSLCLSGAPGTGKSAFARYLARRLGLEVLQIRASDVLGAFVGESERNIARAFEDARDAGAFLIFDEADSLLFDRRDAVRSWEITQVNEMLTWMEEHPLPVCFTTNLMDRMDMASLRRFTFHVRFDFLSEDALRKAYRAFFAMPDVPAGGLGFSNLTPGDFAQARKQADVLGILEDPTRVVELISEISRGKPGMRAATIGFTG